MICLSRSRRSVAPGYQHARNQRYHPCDGGPVPGQDDIGIHAVWGVAGASHSSLYAAKYVNTLVLRDKSFPGKDGPLAFTQVLEQQQCKLSPLFSTVDTGLVLNAALESVHQWILTGKSAAPTLAFERNTLGARRPGREWQRARRCSSLSIRCADG